MSNYLGKVISFEVRKTPTLSATAAAATAAAARLFCFRFVGTGAVVELLAWNSNNTLGQSCREQVKMCSLASRGAVAQSGERPSKGPSLVQLADVGSNHAAAKGGRQKNPSSAICSRNMSAVWE